MNLEEHVLDEMVRSSRWLVRARAALFYVNPTFVTYVGCRRLTSSTSRVVCGAGVRVDAARSLLTWLPCVIPQEALRAILHTILFSRALGKLKPAEVGCMARGVARLVSPSASLIVASARSVSPMCWTSPTRDAE